ncbi:hypothetical protein WN55_07659 [Dufourea novaeangliae]|uniref:Uncharacterized protein n=1 Tax=Dufourea novaeangliae TaxID=178035 RepID=A0A154P7R3_DUFNO|nr:hypothetical protein WN55_07659 [Dufourea novaeangliae]
MQSAEVDPGGRLRITFYSIFIARSPNTDTVFSFRFRDDRIRPASIRRPVTHKDASTLLLALATRTVKRSFDFVAREKSRQWERAFRLLHAELSPKIPIGTEILLWDIDDLYYELFLRAAANLRSMCSTILSARSACKTQAKTIDGYGFMDRFRHYLRPICGQSTANLHANGYVGSSCGFLTASIRWLMNDHDTRLELATRHPSSKIARLLCPEQLRLPFGSGVPRKRNVTNTKTKKFMETDLISSVLRGLETSLGQSKR